MSTKQIFLGTLFLSFSLFINAQNQSFPGWVFVNGGRLEVLSSPATPTTVSETTVLLSNKGVANGMHYWRILSASYGGANGISSNGFEIWENPQETNGTNPARRRFAMLTNRGQSSYKTVFIGPRGSLHIGYPYSQTITDTNDLSVNGNVGIGITNTQGYKLAVEGKIRANEIVVDTGWADFVFEDEYELPSLDEVASHIKEHKHLSGIPTAREVEEAGVNLGEINVKLLQKIEELTLYMIDLKEENVAIKKQLEEFKTLFSVK